MADYQEPIYRAENDARLYALRNRLPMKNPAREVQAFATTFSKLVSQGVQLELQQTSPIVTSASSEICPSVSPTRIQVNETITAVQSHIVPSPTVTSTVHHTVTPTRCSISLADIPGVPHLTGSAIEKVAQILGHYRVVLGLKAGTICPDDIEFPTRVALQHVALLCEDQCSTLIHQFS